MIILGIDPGSRITGYGIVTQNGNGCDYIDSGCIRMSSDSIPQRLKTIFESVSLLIEQYHPDEMAIEAVFMNKNADSALKLGQARGAAICAAVVRDIPVSEYSPRRVKQAVVGQGGAAKAQVQSMMQMLLKLTSSPQADAADALAIAYCHASSSTLYQQLPGVHRVSRGRLR